MFTPQPDKDNAQIEQYTSLSAEELSRVIKEHTPGWSPEREAALKEAERFMLALHDDRLLVKDSLADMLQAFLDEIDGGFDERARISIDLLDIREGITLVMTASGFSIREQGSDYLVMLESKFFVERTVSHDDIDSALRHAAGELIVALKAGGSIDDIFPQPADPHTEEQESEVQLREANIVDSLETLSASRLGELSEEIQFVEGLRQLRSSDVGRQLSNYLRSTRTAAGGSIDQYLKIVELSPEVGLYYSDTHWKVANEQEVSEYLHDEGEPLFSFMAGPFSHIKPTALQGLNLDIEAVREALLGVCERLIASSR